MVHAWLQATYGMKIYVVGQDCKQALFQFYSYSLGNLIANRLTIR